MADDRPSPEQMLARIQTERADRAGGRGRLKIFFGYAAGVGKTYTMLEEARSRAAEGVDVVVGYAEPHARPETEILLLKQELLPCKEVPYQNITLREFDLDAALARKPALIVVDELAHTNAPGLQHTKRYQDVLILLEQGIDVYTTVNVQHLESLNDVVAQITGVRVRETVPDNIFDEADEIELIDIPPDELIERFEQGKVYVAEQAARAATNFFKKANLIALREIALRKTADRVNTQVQSARMGQASGRTWPTRERMLVCIGPSPTSAKVIRSARRMASALHAQWIAVTVETPATGRLSDEDRQRLAQNLQLAERLGAQTAMLSGEEMANEILTYANSRNVTKIVIGKPDARPCRWRWRQPRTVVDDVLARSGEIDVYVIRGFGDISRVPRQETLRRSVDPWPYVQSVGVMALATAAAWVLAWIDFSSANIVMTMLLGIAVVAAWYGLGPAILASVTGALAFNFFFAPPYYSFAITDSQNIITLFVMLVIAIMISTLTARVRWQAEQTRRSHRRTELLYRLSRRLVAATGRRDIAQASEEHLREVFDEEAVLFLPDDAPEDSAKQRVEPRYGRAPAFARQPRELAAAQWVFEHGQIAGRGTDTLPNAQALYLPLEAPGERIGTLAVRPAQERWGLSSNQRQLLETFAAQIALALQREKLADQARRMLIETQAQRTRNTLLSSVSHDLRTPLATIAGASSGLFESNGKLDDATRNELAHTIYEESNRLSRLIENLLHMTRLESGAAKADKQWQPLEEVIGSALRRARSYLHGANVKVDLPDQPVMVPLDGVLIEQVLINLLDNAAKYGGGSPITLRARANEVQATIEVLDQGPGIPPAQADRIFDKFHRLGSTETTGQGAGLGLAICRAIVEAHGGRIWAENRSGGEGARFVFTLPLEGETPPGDVYAASQQVVFTLPLGSEASQVEASEEQAMPHPS